MPAAAADRLGEDAVRAGGIGIARRTAGGDRSWFVTVTAAAVAPEPPLPPTVTFTWLVAPDVVKLPLTAMPASPPCPPMLLGNDAARAAAGDRDRPGAGDRNSVRDTAARAGPPTLTPG